MRQRIFVTGMTAFIVFSLVQTAKSEDISDVFKKSYKLEAKRKTAEAYRIIEEALDKNSGKDNAYLMRMRLGYLNGRRWRYKDAAYQYGKAAEIKPDAIEPITYQEYQYLILKDWEKLKKSARRGLRIDRNNYLSMTRLAYANYMSKYYNIAADEYSKVLTLYPGDIRVRNMLGWSKALGGNKDEALKEFQKVLVVSPYNRAAKRGLKYVKKMK